jgi:hypothetical protein
MMEQIQAILKGLMALCMLVIVGILVYAMNANCATTSVDQIGKKLSAGFIYAKYFGVHCNTEHRVIYLT